MTKLAKTSNRVEVMCNARRTLVYTPRLRDFNFLYDEVFDMYNHYAQLKGKSQPLTKELTGTLLEEAARLSSQTLFPLYESGDIEGCVLKDGLVQTPKGFKEAYKAFAEGG